MFLRKLEYFNSNPAQNTNKLNNRNTGSKLKTTSRDAVNNSVNISKATELSNSNANQDKSDRSKSLTKIFTQVTPKVAPRKADLVQGSQLKKPLFVTKYSPYRGETRKPPASAPLITTAGTTQLMTFRISDDLVGITWGTDLQVSSRRDIFIFEFRRTKLGRKDFLKI